MKTAIIALFCLIAGYAAGVLVTQDKITVVSMPAELNAIAEQPDSKQAAFENTDDNKLTSDLDAYDSSNASTPATDDVAQLHAQISALEQQLNRQRQINADTLKTVQQLRSHGASNSGNAELSTITLAEVLPSLPQPFANLVANAKGSVVDRFKQVESEAIDYDWAPLMEQRIADFIATHALSTEVQMQAVRCKSKICEVRGFEKAAQSWNQIQSSMQAQPWWGFTSTHSSSSHTEEFGQYFYMVATIFEQQPVVSE